MHNLKPGDKAYLKYTSQCISNKQKVHVKQKKKAESYKTMSTSCAIIDVRHLKVAGLVESKSWIACVLYLLDTLLKSMTSVNHLWYLAGKIAQNKCFATNNNDEDPVGGKHLVTNEP